MDKKELADTVRKYRGERSRREMANQLHIPVRTLEAIENGRGFRYPGLLVFAMQGWSYLEERKYGK